MGDTAGATHTRRSGAYPYKNLLSRKRHEKQEYALQVELLKLQAWVKESGQRVVVLFEGRDAAGKGGAIKRVMERHHPRGARVVALEKPSEVERGQWQFQRYVQHLPTTGKIVLFERSWYNRAGIKRVMRLCTDNGYQEFMPPVPQFEPQLVRSGVHLVIESGCKKRARPNAMRDALHRRPCSNKDLVNTGSLDSLLVGRAPVVYERGARPARASL